MSEKLHNLRFPLRLAAACLVVAAGVTLAAAVAALYALGLGELVAPAVVCGAVVTAIALVALVPVWYASTLGPANLPTAWLASTTLRLLLIFAAGAALVLTDVAEKLPVAGFMLLFYLVSLAVEAVLAVRFTADARHDWVEPSPRRETASC